VVEGDNNHSVSYEFSGKITADSTDNSITLAKGTTGNIILDNYIFSVIALNNSGSKLNLDNDGVILTPDSGAINISITDFNLNSVFGGDLNCTKGKITVGYNNEITFADDTSFELKQKNYTLAATTVDNAKVSILLVGDEITFKPVENEGSLHLTLKKDTTTIFDNTLSISGGSVVLSQADREDRRKISLTQGTTVKIEKDDTIITATAKEDTAAYIWQDTKGIFYFKIDDESANFDLNIAQSDGTETFSGELTLGGCVTYDGKTFSFISDPVNNNGYETFIQLKNDNRTIYVQTEGKTVIADAQLKDGKITANFKKKGNNSIYLEITKDESEVFNNVVTVDGSIVVDLLQADFSVNKGTTITTDSGLIIKNSLLTVSKDFSGSSIDLTTYEKVATKADASKLSTPIAIYGNISNNSIKGGKGDDIITGDNGNDTIYGGNGNDFIDGGSDNDKLYGDAGDDTITGGTGNDTLTGGKGADVFIFEGGEDLITDYKAGEDSIMLNQNAITNSTVKGSDVILTTEEGTLTIKGTKDKAITFVDEEGNATDKIFFADTSYSPLETGLSYNSKRTILTASSKFNGYMIDLNDHLSTATKINASAVNQELFICGNDLNNSIRGGKNDDFISGGSGNDTLTGGAGNDTFYCDNGDDVITDYKAGEDSILVNEKISKVEYSGQNVILTYGEGTITVKNAKGKEISVIDSSGETQIYSKTFDILYDDNFVTDEFSIDDVVGISENNYFVGQIENSGNKNDFMNDTIITGASSEEK
jgi:Ca2+-binding RTX toxin-like protein